MLFLPGMEPGPSHAHPHRSATTWWVAALATLALALTAVDHWTTWICLQAPIEGWEVQEANPIADWLFRHAGLGPGLLIDSVVTVAAIGLLLASRSFGPRARLCFLALLVGTTGYAVVNNLQAISRLGLSPLGVG